MTFSVPAFTLPDVGAYARGKTLTNRGRRKYRKVLMLQYMMYIVDELFSDETGNKQGC